jgi:acyl-CoA thioester hydrolase
MDNPNFKSCEIKLAVPFHDLDPLNMVWHGNYLKYFDMARSALFASAGLDLFEYIKDTSYIFPITKTSSKHIVSLRYQDEFICTATCLEAQYKIVIDFKIRLVKDNTLCAKGRSEQVTVKCPEMEMMFEIPHDVRTALGF